MCAGDDADSKAEASFVLFSLVSSTVERELVVFSSISSFAGEE